MRETKRRTVAAGRLAGALVLVLVTITCIGTARAAELIPSLGITQSTDANAGDAQGFAGLALRASVLPFLKLEGAIGYRQESFAGGDLKVRQWPVSASAWVTPFPMLYAGGGLGWYRTTLDYRSTVPLLDATTQKVGVHLGGGIALPITTQLGLDLNGRYIFMQKDKATPQLPTTFDPNFWNVAVGLAIKF